MGFESLLEATDGLQLAFVRSLLKVKAIVEHEGDDIHKSFEHDDLKLGFQFLADMINRVFFMLVVLAEIIAFSATILMTMGSRHSDDARLEAIKQLELQN